MTLEAATALFRAGQIREGWEAYEGRDLPKIPLGDAPLWKGEELLGKSIYLHAEQGLGDEILFASIVPELIALGAHPMLSCSPQLVPLFQRAFFGCEVTNKVRRPDLRRFAYQLPAASLGKFFRPTRDSFPGRAYLSGPFDLELRQKYRDLAKERKIIGVAWYSLKKPAESVRLHQMLDHVPPESFLVNLQYGDTYAERMGYDADSAWAREIYTDISVDQLTDMDRFALQVETCDAVYTTSNTTAHVAGALGVKTHLFLTEQHHWYWDLPWYPNLTIHTL